MMCVTLSLVLSCSPKGDDTKSTATDPSDDTPEACFESGDILVASSGLDALTVFSADGTFKRVAYYVLSAVDKMYGITWSASTQEVLVAIDGVDRVVAVSASDCSTRDAVLDSNLSGNIRGITQLKGSSDDILVIETNNIERFGANGNRVTSGWPLAAQTGGTGIAAMANGGFVHCSNGSDVLRTYNAAGVQQATKSSGIAGTTDATDCMELADGSIAVAWSGTTDTVAVYNSTLTTLNSSFSNTAYLNNPGGLAQRANGNLLVVDRVYNQVVEITQAGVFQSTFGAGYLATPEYILVVP